MINNVTLGGLLAATLAAAIGAYCARRGLPAKTVVPTALAFVAIAILIEMLLATNLSLARLRIAGAAFPIELAVAAILVASFAFGMIAREIYAGLSIARRARRDMQAVLDEHDINDQLGN